MSARCNSSTENVEAYVALFKELDLSNNNLKKDMRPLDKYEATWVSINLYVTAITDVVNKST